MTEKANEFEHGLMLGYLLIKGRQNSGYPKDGTDERTISDGVLKTWVEKTYDKNYDEAYGIFQTLTHSDGTVENWSNEDFTSTRPYTGLVRIDKGTWLGWELAEPDDTGVISTFYYYLYDTANNQIKRKRGVSFQWGILTEG